MPGRLTRKAMALIDEHANSIIFVMFAVMLTVAVFAAIGWHNARNAQRRLNTVETTLEAERLGKRIADVSTCFNQAHSRPRLIVILRGIQTELAPDPRQALGDLIDEYEGSTPTETECARLARRKGIDPMPYLNDPPSEAAPTEEE